MAKNVKRYSQGGSFKNINIGGASALQQQRAHSQTVIQGLERQRNAVYQRDKDAIQSAIEAERAEKEQRRINFNLTEAEYSTREKALERNSRRDRENTEQLKANLKQKAESIQAFSKIASEGFKFAAGKVAEAQAEKDFKVGWDKPANITDAVAAERVLDNLKTMRSNSAVEAAKNGTPAVDAVKLLWDGPALTKVNEQKGLAARLISENTFADIFDSTIRAQSGIISAEKFEAHSHRIVQAFYQAYGLDKHVDASHLSALKQHTQGIINKHITHLKTEKAQFTSNRNLRKVIEDFQKHGFNSDGTLNQEILKRLSQAGFLQVDDKGNYGGNTGSKEAIKEHIFESRHSSQELLTALEDEGVSPNLTDLSTSGLPISKMFTENEFRDMALERSKDINKASKAGKEAEEALNNKAYDFTKQVIDSDDYIGTLEQKEALFLTLRTEGVSNETISRLEVYHQTKGFSRDLVRAESSARILINSGRFTVEDYNNLHPLSRGKPFFKTAKDTAVEFNRVLDSKNINITNLSVGRFKHLLTDKSVAGSHTPSVTLGSGLFEKTLRQNFNSRWHSELKKSIETRKSADEVWSEVYTELDDLITKVNNKDNPDTTSPWYAARDPGEETATLPNILSRSSNTGPMSKLPQEKGYSIEGLANEPYRALWMPWVKPEYIENLKRSNEYGQPLEIPEDVHKISEVTGFPVHQLLNSWTKYYENNGVLQKGELFKETIQYKILKQPDVQKSNALIQTLANKIKTYRDLQTVNLMRVFPEVVNNIGLDVFQEEVP